MIVESIGADGEWNSGVEKDMIGIVVDCTRRSCTFESIVRTPNVKLAKVNRDILYVYDMIKYK